jgi:translocation and assembly module TamB
MLRASLRSLGVGLVFVTALVGSALVHLDIPVVRRLVLERVNLVLASAFAGRIVLERVGALGLSSVESLDARVDDPDGHTVIRVSNMRASVSTFALLRSLLVRGPIAVDVSELSATGGEVSFDADASGVLRLVKAFEPFAAPSHQAARPVNLALDRVRMGHLLMSGQPTPALPIDADVDHLVASLSLTAGVLEVHVSHAEVLTRGVPAGVTASGVLEADLVQPSARGGDRALRGEWRGTLGGIAETVHVSYDGGEVEGTLDVPAATPEEVRTLWPLSPLGEPASVRAEARGTLPQVSVRAHASLGRSALDVAGSVSFGAPTAASLALTARAIDAHALWGGAPRTSISGSGHVSLSGTADGDGRGDLQFDIDAGTIGKLATPASTLHADFVHDLRSPEKTLAHARLSVHEPGAPTDLALQVTPLGSSVRVAFDATADAPRLDSMPRFDRRTLGHARVTAHGTFDVETDKLDAQIDAIAGDISGPNFGLGRASMRAHAKGELQSVGIDATLDANELVADGMRFDSAHATTHGPLRHRSVDVSLRGHEADVRATADVTVGDGKVTAREVRIRVEDRGERVVARSPQVTVSGSELRVEDAEIDGVGARLHVDVHRATGQLEVRARSDGLDLGRLARLGRLKEPAAGLLSLDVDASVRSQGASGHVLLGLSGGSFANWRDASGAADAAFDGRRASGHVSARLGDASSLDVSVASMELGGAEPLATSSWRRAWGSATFGVHVDLARLAAQAPAGALPWVRPSGVLDVKGQLGRDSESDATPDVEVDATTTGLALTGTVGPSPWHVEGIDATAHLHVDGNTGATALAAQVAAAAGVLATLGMTSDAVPYDRLFANDDVLDALAAMPFEATVRIPEQQVASLPTVLHAGSLRGLLQGTIGWRGTILQPTVTAEARLRQGRSDVTVLALPVDLDFSSNYDGAHAAAALSASAHGRDVLEVGSEINARLGDLVAGLRGVPIPWNASARAQLTNFPIQSIGAADDRHVRGSARGHLSIDRLNDNASASLALDVDQLTVGDVACKAAQLRASVDGAALEGSLRLDQDDGFADVKVSAGSRWGSDLTPSLDASKPAEFTLGAKRFRTELLLPFVHDLFAQLDGRVDSHVDLRVEPGAPSVKAQGTLAFDKGVVELNAIGGEFHDVSANLALTPDGVVRIANVSARGLTGHLQGAATVRLDGLAFGGARALLQVPNNEPIPLVVEGVQLGVFYGRVDIASSLSADRSGMDVTVDVPSLHLELPLASGHSVQQLGAVDGVRVLTRRAADLASGPPAGAEDSPRARAPSTKRVKIDVRLGDDVEVQRGTDLDVRLAGHPTMVLSDKVRASGQILIVRGTLDVQGKPFAIDNGTVTFVEDDPTNPQVSLTATWTAPDGTHVYADFVGPLKTGSVTLRSEPARAKNEILSLILFGTTDEQAPTSTGASQQASTAVGAAGGAATQPINSALGGVNHMLDKVGLVGGISTKVDTSQTTPRPEVEVQIARDISLQVAWVLGVPPPGSNPDSTLFTLNWRFLRKWSLQTTVGSAGTSVLDLIWQHRY